jgi:transglutaminase-like putative cysteine protease
MNASRIRARLGRTRFRPMDVAVLFAAGLLVIQAPLSVVAAGWVPNLEPLPRLAVLGLAAGYLIERTRAPGLLGLPLGLALGIETVAWTYADLAPAGSLSDRVAWLSARVGDWIDTIAGGGVSNDPLVFALTMALLAWLLGQLTAWLVFRDTSPWLAILFCGVGLLMNLSYASTSLVGYVTWFGFAACLLLASVQLANRAELWRRAQLGIDWRIGLNLLLGTALAAGALLSVAWALPDTASPEIASGWSRVTAPWQGLEGEFDRWFAALNASDRNARGLSFGRTLAPRGAFDLGDTPVLQVRAPGPLYLRATTADRYAGQAITSSDSSATAVAANADVVAQDALPLDRAAVQAQVRILASRTSVAFTPDTPLRFSQSTQVETRGTLDDIAAIRFDVPVQQNQEYTVVSALSTATAQELRAAGEDYPDWVRSRYLQLPRRMPRRVLETARSASGSATSAYDRAINIESFLRNNYTYSTHVPTPPPDRDWVDYFLFDSKQGYCDYFATAMTILLRMDGVPARVASGFAPGDYDDATGASTVRENHAHTWVEAYFPRYGWIVFEPSAIRPIPTRFEEPPQAVAAPPPPAPSDASASGNLTQQELDELLRIRDGDNGGVAPAQSFFTTLPGVLVLVLLAMCAFLTLGAGVLAVAWRRGMGRLAAYQRPYAQLTRLARWSGSVRGGASDTPFEFGDRLARQVPSARTAIDELTSAYVEGTYAQHAPSSDPWPAWLGARANVIRGLFSRRLPAWLGRDETPSDAAHRARPELLRDLRRRQPPPRG